MGNHAWPVRPHTCMHGRVGVCVDMHTKAQIGGQREVKLHPLLVFQNKLNLEGGAQPLATVLVSF